MTNKAAASLLLSNDNFLILTHLNPDGDTIGSAAALCSALRRLGKTAYLYLNTQIPQYYSRFFSFDFFQTPDFKPDFIIAADIADTQLFPKQFSGKVNFCVDHHPSNKNYTENLLLNSLKSSTGEIVNKLILSLGLKPTAEEATLLYIALSTDTGCFKYQNTNSASFLAASEYAAAGADVFAVNKLFFNTKSPARASLEGRIYSGVKYFYDGKFAMARISLDDIRASGAGEADMDNLAGLVSCLEGTVITATVKELENGFCKVSLRSDVLDCSEICSNFGGGGHHAAAGCNIHAGLDRAEKLLVDVLEGYIR